MSKTIEISDSLYEEIKDQLCADEATEIGGWTDLVGEKLFIRTVTFNLIGKVVAINGTLIELRDASVVFDTERFMQCIKDGALKEVEPVGRAFVNLAAITDAFPWNHTLQQAQK